MFIPILLALFTQFRGLNGQVDANGISLYEKIEEMERQILNPFTLVNVVTPCSVNFNDDPNRGEQTSAEWVRIVFHDAITKNIAGPGLGGVDASIGFESDRAENVGIFVNVTLGQFSQFSSVFLSMSDMIALGLSDSLATCDPTARRIPLRVGRIDATGPGPAGVPGPLDSLAFARNAFNTAGFSNTEMIQAVACGHTLGGVHHSNFPDIVPELNDPTNTDSRAPWDTSPAIFDNAQTVEYLDGTGRRGGPLVTGPSASNSDFRIFNSDGNATLTAMRSATAFRNTCFTVFEKMINTVPSAVTLSSPLVPRPWLLRKGLLDLNSAGQVTFEGTIIGHGPGPLPTTAAYQYMTIGNGNTGPKISQAGTPYPIVANTPIGFGTITDYPFKDILNSPNINSINIQNTYSSPINQNIFILPSQSFRNPMNRPDGTLIQFRFVVRAAILSSLAPAGTTLSLKLFYPDHQAGTVVPKIVSKTTTMTLKTTLGSYKIFQATVTAGDGVNNVAGGTLFFKVSKGTTDTSAYVDPVSWAVCTNSPMTTC